MAAMSPTAPTTATATATSSTAATTSTSHLPLPIVTSDIMLSSSIALPANPAVLYAIYVPVPDVDAHDALERARQALVLRNSTYDLLYSYLPSVAISKSSYALYVYAIASRDRIDSLSEFRELTFEGLSVSECSSFTPEDIYPCSVSCAEQRTPCSSCLASSPLTTASSSTADAGTSTSAAAILLPRRSLRAVYAHFLDAVRTRIIDDISRAAAYGPARGAKRFKDGFLLGGPAGLGAGLGKMSSGSSGIAMNKGAGEWGSDWLWYASMRPLILCQLAVHLTSSSIIVHPLLRTTSLIPLPVALALSSPPAQPSHPSTSSPPPPFKSELSSASENPAFSHFPSRPLLSPGSPIALLPYGVPAYYLSAYVGPHAGLTQQFSRALAGLGIGAWDARPSGLQMYKREDEEELNYFLSRPSSLPFERMTSSSSASSAPRVHAMYIIAWLAVQNTQGEDKGMPIIWPSRLCTAFHPAHSMSHPTHKQSRAQSASTSNKSGRGQGHARTRLSHIPTLPPQLQPSPTPSPATLPRAPASEFVGASPSHLADSPSPASATQLNAPSPVQHIQPFSEQSNPHTFPTAKLLRRLPVAPTSDAARALRAFTSQHSCPLTLVAQEVRGYVEAVAKERERERERLRRERENAASGAGRGGSAIGIGVGGMAGTPSHASVPSTPAFGAGAASRNIPATPTPTQQIQQHTPTSTPTVTPQHQHFYPSPPQVSPTARGHMAADEEQSYPLVGPTVASGNAGSLSGPSEHQPHSTSIPSATQVGSPTPHPTSASGSALSQTAASSTPAASSISQAPGAASTSVLAPASYDADPFGHMDDFMTMDMADSMNLRMNIGMDARTGMDMDYDMEFGMNMTAPSGAGGGAGRMGSDDFEDNFTFTDDDFSFFDRPSANAGATVAGSTHTRSQAIVPASTAASAPTAVHLSFASGDRRSHPLRIHPGALLPLASGSIPLDFPSSTFHDAPLQQLPGSGPGPPSASPFALLASPWVHPGDRPTPDLIVGSPSHSSPSHSAPTTPTVQLFPFSPNSSYTDSGKYGIFDAFDPIPFAPSHRIADGKYAFGKFSFTPPSPPDEEDRTEPAPMSLRETLAQTQGWRGRYNEVTDPRIGVVRKLIGVKRKSIDQGTRDATAMMHPSWMREHEDWTSEDVIDVEGSRSEAESDEEEPEIEDTSTISRTSTPPPSYLPLGPRLLHARFQHAFLLPQSNPLRPPGAAVAPNNIAPMVASVPTPVSPAAALGAASERSKSLEAAGYVVAREVIENPVWANAWRASMVSSLSVVTTAIWRTDVQYVAQLIKDVALLQGPLDMQSLFTLNTSESSPSEDAPLQLLDPPMLLMSKSDCIVQVLPAALRFWEKLGLGPRSGKKNVSAFVLFEDDGPEKQHRAEAWLNNMSATYTAKQFGNHVPGKCGACPQDGMVPLRFENFRKTLVSFIASLPCVQSSMVFYIATPSHMMSLASPLLRQIFSAVKRAQKTYSEVDILFQFIPEQLIVSVDTSSSQETELTYLCYSVYRRTRQHVNRYMSRRIFEDGERSCSHFQEVPLSLARPLPPKAKFVREAHPRSLDVMDRYTLLHVGYKISSCGKWLLAACSDQRGEAYDIGVWLIQSDLEISVISQVWSFALQFARKADVEWRIAFTKLGTMEANELDDWVNHLALAVPSAQDLAPFHASVLCVEQDMPWAFLGARSSNDSPTAPKRPPSKEISNPMYVDVSTATYALFPSIRFPLSSVSTHSSGANVELSFIPETEDELLSDRLPILPVSTTSLIHVPVDSGHSAISMLHIHLLHTTKSSNCTITIPDYDTHKEITRNFHELAVLGQLKLNLRPTATLPAHLTVLDIMDDALKQSDVE